jgi:hypothetical protein
MLAFGAPALVRPECRGLRSSVVLNYWFFGGAGVLGGGSPAQGWRRWHPAVVPERLTMLFLGPDLARQRFGIWHNRNWMAHACDGSVAMPCRRVGDDRLPDFQRRHHPPANRVGERVEHRVLIYRSSVMPLHRPKARHHHRHRETANV